MDFCKECRGRCVFTASDLTCTQCGLEQGEPVIIPDFNWIERAAPMDTISNSQGRPDKYIDMFDELETTLNMPSSVMDIARSMYKSYINKHPSKGGAIKGVQRHKEFIGACVMFSSRTLHTGALSQKSVIDRLNDPIIVSIQWACKDLESFLGNDPEFAYVFKERKPVTWDSISKMMRIVCEDIASNTKSSTSIEETIKRIRPIALKLHDRIANDHRISLLNPEKLNATLIMMACKATKAPMTLKRIAALLKTSEPTILKLEKLIKEICSN